MSYLLPLKGIYRIWEIWLQWRFQMKKTPNSKPLRKMNWKWIFDPSLRIAVLGQMVLDLVFTLRAGSVCQGGSIRGCYRIFQWCSPTRYFSSSYIFLIPKMKKSNSYGKFRPISLYSMAYKIFSKIMVHKLAGHFNKIISSEQGAFYSW